MTSQRIPVAVLGATGMVGQHFIKFLRDHPWFELKWLGASDRSAGKKFRAATIWRLDGQMPGEFEHLTVEESKPGNAPRLLFSAMDASVISIPRFGKAKKAAATSNAGFGRLGGFDENDESHGGSFSEPFVSPDSRWGGMWIDNEIEKSFGD